MRPGRPPTLLAAPNQTLISVEQVKAVQRIDAADEDALIETWIAAATAHVETILSRKLVGQDWLHQFCGWGDYELRLGLPDTDSVDVSYYDADLVEQELAADQYWLVEDRLGSVLVPREGIVWPSLGRMPYPVLVVATHGISAVNSGDPALTSIAQALHLIVGYWLNHRESVTAGNVISAPVAASVDRLLVEHRAAWADA